MLKAAASVEGGGTMTLAAEPMLDPSAQDMSREPDGKLDCRDNAGNNMKQAPAITRFAYATGSRPLDGYTVKRGVGAGGFGEVYFAVSDAGKEVALKRIQRNLDIEIRGVSQCLNLKHPNLVAIFDIRYDDEGQAWVVMEFVRGECLKDVIERNPNGLPTGELLGWFRGIAAGVSCLHDHGIVHRDLKPGNIFLDEGVVKIGDYGLSKYISCSRRSGQTESVGTFHYMAPEIGRGVYGKEIDVYALGIILYELLTGRVPFDGESSHEIIMKHLTALPDVEPLPEKIRPIVQRALFKDPTKRYRHVGEMLVSLESACGATPSHSYVSSSSPIASSRPEPMYIGGSEDTEGMFFGPVQQISTATVVPESPLAPKNKTIAATDEPIAVAVRDAVKQMFAWWNSSALNKTARFILVALFVFLFFTNAAWIVPLAIVLGTIYLVYFGVRAIMLSLDEPSSGTVRHVSQPVAAAPVTTPVAAQPASPVARPKPNGAKKRRKWHDVAREQLARKSAGERLTELTGSMLMSALVVAVISFLTLIVAGTPIDGSPQMWTSFSWTAIMSVLGTWLLLIPGKSFEGNEGDEVRRRFLNLILGLVLGVVGFGLTNFLDIRLAGPALIETPTVWNPPNGTFAADGVPRLPAFLAYFGGLFLLLRWWLQTDPLRPGRFSLWSTIVTVLVACAWHAVWPFPQPWSLAVPATMSIALQLSSSWLTADDRNQIRKLVEV